MPRLGPSCLVLFSPRMLLHPYIHLARKVARDEITSRGKSARPGRVLCAPNDVCGIILYQTSENHAQIVLSMKP